MRTLTHRLIVALLVLFGILGCSSRHVLTVPEPVPDDRRTIERPGSQHFNELGDAFDQLIIRQGEQLLDMSRGFRHMTNRLHQSMNINAFDEVENSSWFTNRNAHQRMSIEDLNQGPNTGTGPSLEGTWLIQRAKTEGVTPGFTIEDSRGDHYVIKFDPTGFPEIASAAEVIGTKFFYAAGYFTPENYLVRFDPSILRIDEGVLVSDGRGGQRQMIESDIEEILSVVDRLPDGRIRVAASKYIEGRPVGPFSFVGTREDDPNDIIPHEHRRELRGLAIMSNWLGHVDTKAGNTLDSYITDENGNSYVRHFLIDFGTTMGSGGRGETPPYRGTENEFDPHEFLVNIFTFGLYVRPWETNFSVPYRSVGYFTAEDYDPSVFKPMIPNAAFENMTWRDAYWGAKQVMSFSDEQIAAAVAQGELTDPDAAEYLVNVLIERRDIIGRYWFSRMNPLDNFTLQGNIVHFDDLAVTTGLEDAETTSYRYRRISDFSSDCGEWNHSDECSIGVESNGIVDGEPYFGYEIQTRRGNQDWSNWVRIYLRVQPSRANLELYGLLRQEI